MFGSRLFWQIYLGYVVLVLISAALVGVLVAREIEREVREETRLGLERALAIVFESIGEVPVNPGREESARLRELLVRASRASGARLTLFAPDRSVVADSESGGLPADEEAALPELEQAAHSGVGVSVRPGGAPRSRVMHLARRAPERAGFVRAALPLDAVEARRAGLQRAVAAGTALAAGLALLLAVPVSRRFSAPFGKMSQTARSIAAGEYHRRLTVDRSDEIGAFAHAFNVMAGTLQERIETLTEERNRASAVLSGMVEGVVAVDGEERVIHMNEPAGQITGTDPRDALGRPFASVTRMREIVESLRETLASGVERTHETLLPARDGHRVLEIHSAPIRGSGPSGSGAIVVLHDVTELRRLEGVRRDFVANVSHELKTPLTVVRGIVETLLDDPTMDEETRRRFLGKVSVQAERLSSIVSDLLTLARIESHDPAAGRERMDLRDPVRESVRALAPSAESRGVHLSVVVSDDPAIVRGDRSSLRLVVDNLLDNAVKYTPRGGSVVLSLVVDGGAAAVEVRDTGIGIDPQHGDRIFERFYRVDRGRSRELGGTGLGLSIVRNAVEAHGGRVEYESEPGRGSAFRFRIPLDEPALPV
jgi:two-component system phosphate regulon sensor histidine kinase PhoR